MVFLDDSETTLNINHTRNYILISLTYETHFNDLVIFEK